jgi:hypothetical protein
MIEKNENSFIWRLSNKLFFLILTENALGANYSDRDIVRLKRISLFLLLISVSTMFLFFIPNETSWNVHLLAAPPFILLVALTIFLMNCSEMSPDYYSNVASLRKEFHEVDDLMREISIAGRTTIYNFEYFQIFSLAKKLRNKIRKKEALTDQSNPTGCKWEILK